MGLFSGIKNFFAVAKAVSQTKKEYTALMKKAKTMTAAEAAALDDAELVLNVSYRTEMEGKEPSAMSEPVRFVHTIWAYEAEVNNGGLCQYFVNSSRETAPFLEKALSAVGAKRHLALFHGFVTSNRIDVNDLSQFIIDDVDEFEEKNELYPFDAFDDAFYELEAEETLDTLCAAYIRQHLKEFFG